MLSSWNREAISSRQHQCGGEQSLNKQKYRLPSKSSSRSAIFDIDDAARPHAVGTMHERWHGDVRWDEIADVMAHWCRNFVLWFSMQCISLLGFDAEKPPEIIYFIIDLFSGFTTAHYAKRRWHLMLFVCVPMMACRGSGRHTKSLENHCGKMPLSSHTVISHLVYWRANDDWERHIDDMYIATTWG